LESQTNLNHIFRMFIRRSIIICYQLTCFQPHLLSTLSVSLGLGLTCSRHTCYPASLFFRSICYQASLAIRTFALQSQLLSMLICYPKLSKYVAIKISCFLIKLLSKQVLSCYHKLVSWSISCYQNQYLFAIKNLFFLNKKLSKLVLSCYQKRVAF